MRKIKIFGKSLVDEYSHNQLEEEINKFIENNNILVLDTKVVYEQENEWIYIILLYKKESE